MTRLLTLLLLLPPLAAIAGPGDPWFPCRSCHGDAGEGSPAIHAPALAGQEAGYIARQLRHFRDGLRGSHPRDTWGRQMALMAANLDDREIDRLAAQIAAMAPAPQSAAAGSLTVPDSYRACTACHGERGQGNAALLAPRIAGLDSVYIATQLRNFRDGIRGGHADDPAGRQMGAAASGLREEGIAALARYLQAPQSSGPAPGTATAQ
jgi:cytochrome c553